MKLNFNSTFYIALSFLLHILLIGILGSYSFTETKSTVFNVDIIAPPEDWRLPEQKMINPAVPKRKPPIIRDRRPPVNESKIETLFDEGVEPTGKGKENPDSPKLTEESGKSGDDDLISPRDMHDPLQPENENRPGLPRSYLFDRKTIEKYARKGSPPGKGLSLDMSEFRHRGYMRILQERIERIWNYPEEAARLGISGDLYMTFSIKRDGSLGEIEIVRTSGHRSLDEAAMKALKDAAPFWPLPDDWEGESLDIRGHFIYIFGQTFVL